MRHRVYGRHLGRNRNERENLFRGLVCALFLHGTISLSSSKAQAVKGLVDKIITQAKSKRDDLLQTFIADKSIRERLIKEILPKLGTRTSGFTSIVRVGKRLGDQTTMVKMSLIGAEKLEPFKKELKKEKLPQKTNEPEKIKKTSKVKTQGKSPKLKKVKKSNKGKGK